MFKRYFKCIHNSKIFKFVSNYHDSLIIFFIIIFFMWKFIFFPDLFKLVYVYIKNNFLLIYETIQWFFKK